MSHTHIRVYHRFAHSSCTPFNQLTHRFYTRRRTFCSSYIFAFHPVTLLNQHISHFAFFLPSSPIFLDLTLFSLLPSTTPKIILFQQFPPSSYFYSNRILIS